MEQVKEQFLVEEEAGKYGKINTFKDLLVWKRGMELVRQVYIATRYMPEEERFGLTAQIRRSAVSVPCNIAEGWGRDSSGNFIQYLRIANGSICEVETQLILIEMLELLEGIKLEKAKKLSEETGKMLRSLIGVLEKRTKNN
ncbi:MAG: four helix bundle protein [Bacteroidota bacterium]